MLTTARFTVGTMTLALPLLGRIGEPFYVCMGVWGGHGGDGTDREIINAMVGKASAGWHEQGGDKSKSNQIKSKQIKAASHPHQSGGRRRRRRREHRIRGERAKPWPWRWERRLQGGQGM